MNSKTYLSLQPDTLQEPPLMKKKSNPVWNLIVVATVFPLCIANLQYLLFLYSWSGSSAFRNQFTGTVPYLLGLVAADLVMALLYLGKKVDLNWKVIFTILVMINLIFYSYILFWAITPSADGYLPLILLGAFPYFLFLSVVDFIAIFIKGHPHDSIAYITLFVINLSLLLLGFGITPVR